MKSIVSFESCLYCSGEGYFHVMVGGTENCPQCQGTGKNPEDRAVPLAVMTGK
ncbi:YuiA family protein [Brevibacillus fluminis]|uniref:YuiA family protein n=1 Tax=Brevibacillus fluminis TaxID=511487 RepID=UPI00160614CE|nr:YuiA family protein [Brevibacillus fluminis]